MRMQRVEELPDEHVGPIQICGVASAPGDNFPRINGGRRFPHYVGEDWSRNSFRTRNHRSASRGVPSPISRPKTWERLYCSLSTISRWSAS